ncbi:MAG: DUF2800 domain-containing protein, partial [Patescibacteria group bacterium]|nr:DUF2800 domain-containing protein [Patescibacteria group bacterium]
HSPLGASSAERWMNCPGSSVLLKRFDCGETDDPTYRKEGTAAHEAAKFCLENDLDTWELIGQDFEGITFDRETAAAVQVYLALCRSLMASGATVMVEQRIGEDEALRPHPSFYGTVDFAAYGPDILDVVDYKHGAGIVVEPDENPQMMYYAYGVIYDRQMRGIEVRSDRVVRLTIVQPRAFHADGPVRSWETTAGEIIAWAENELLPAMRRAETDKTFECGAWCRFCPAKLVCPLLKGMFGAAARANPESVSAMTPEEIGREYPKIAAVKQYVAALEAAAYQNLTKGVPVPNTKLVQKKASRIYRDGAADYFREQFGDEAMTVPELKSPAAMEKVSEDAKKAVREWCYVPVTGYTVALDSDRRPAVTVASISENFRHLLENRTDN